MSFKYACFVSYCHGNFDLINTFIPQLAEALKAELDAYLDAEVFIDRDRMKTGYHFNEKLAEAICQSVCMIVVYYPKYKEHIYCLREYTAMEMLEGKRLGPNGPRGEGLIIPIILRGDIDELPPKIKNHTHCADFSHRSTASQVEVLKDEKCVEKIREIAKYIKQQSDRLKNAAACDDCNTFTLPDESQVSWSMPTTVSTPDFPMR